jgi:hypothetical protein
MSGFKLYEIDSMLRDALGAAEATIDQDTGIIPDDWAKFLDDVQMERDKKCLAVAAYIREQIAYADAVKMEAKRLLEHSRTADNKIDRMKQYLSCVVAVGEKLKDERVSIGWHKSSAVIIDDEGKLPESCFRVIREVSKTTVKNNLIEGGLPDGAAHIEERQNISIR